MLVDDKKQKAGAFTSHQGGDQVPDTSQIEKIVKK